MMKTDEQSYEEWLQELNSTRGINCPENPMEPSRGPLGMYHCPYCHIMLIVGFPHTKPSWFMPDKMLDEMMYKGHKTPYEERYLKELEKSANEEFESTLDLDQ